ASTRCFFFSSRRRHTRFSRDWSSDVCSSDLGQGDAVVVETPREVWLIDSGGRMPWQPEPWQQREDMFDVGEDVVLPYLQHRGIQIGRASCRERGYDTADAAP